MLQLYTPYCPAVILLRQGIHSPEYAGTPKGRDTGVPREAGNMLRKQLLVSLVLAAMAGLLYGCGDNTTAPEITIPNDEAPILAPVNISAQITSNGIELSWDANPQTHLRGYNVYRADHSAGTIARLNNTELTVNRYTDHSATPDTEYQYRVTAVSIKGAESRPAMVTVVKETPRGGKDPKRDDR